MTQTRFVPANGFQFEVAECGSGHKLAICLHGFPEHAVSWRQQLPMLAELGFRAWAPNQRGYGRSSRPGKVQDYALGHLVEDIAALVDASGAHSTVLIAHDWGGVVAWAFAAKRTRPLEALIVLNMPHPICFRRALGRWRQMVKSWYIAAFQVPWLPDRLLSMRRGWLVEKILRGPKRESARFPRDILDVLRSQSGTPGGATAMLAWYRAAIRGGWKNLLAGLDQIIDVPTLIIWDEDDLALDQITLEGTERYVSDLTIRKLPGVSHWVQQDAPDAVNALIAEFLKSKGIVR